MKRTERHHLKKNEMGNLTMQVVDATMGYSADYWQRVDRLLAKLP